MFRHWRKAYKRHTHYYGICDTGMRSSHKRDGHIVFLIDNTCVIVALTVIKYAKSGCHVCVCVCLCVYCKCSSLLYTPGIMCCSLFIWAIHIVSIPHVCVCVCFEMKQLLSHFLVIAYTFIYIHTYVGQDDIFKLAVIILHDNNRRSYASY